MGMIRLTVVVAILAVSLVACEKTNWETHIFHARDTSKESLVTDAKQRVIWNRRQGDGRFLCAEPSPDVAQAFSEAMKIAASLAGESASPDGSTKKIDASGSFARSYAGAVAQLGERLAVIQLLRDEMYRACEAYANGALTKVSYTLKLARLDKKMATLLSSEMAAGAFGRPLAAIGSAASVEGVDAETLKKAEAAAKAEVAKLKKIGAKAPEAGKEAEKTKALDDQLKKTDAAIQSLVQLQQANARLAASASTESVGGLNVEVTAETQRSLVEIHRNFLDDTGVEPLIDACVTAMSTVDFNTLMKAEEVRAELKLYENTAQYLEEMLEDGVLIGQDQETVKKFLQPLTAEFDTDGRPTPGTVKAMHSTIAAVDKKVESLAKLGKGGAFAFTCMNTFLAEDLTDEGFIGRMIKSKKEMQKSVVSVSEAKAKAVLAQVKLMQVKACIAAANLLEAKNAKQEALAKCAAN